MIHYNVWFALKEGIDESRGLQIVEEFLRQLCIEKEVMAFRLLRNTGKEPRTKLPRFQAIIEFSDEEALARSMKNQGERGIHAGTHGRIIDVVSEFRVEIFKALPKAAPMMEYACEI